MLLVDENIFSLSAPRASSIRRAPFALSPPPLEEASTPCRLLFLHASGRRGPISHFFAGAAPQCPPSHVFEAPEEMLQQKDELVVNQLDLRHIWIQELQLKHDCDICTLSRQDGAEQLVRSSATDAAASPAPTPPSDLPPRYQAEEANTLRKQVEQISAPPISSSISNGTDNSFAAAMSKSVHPSPIPSHAPPSTDSADLDSATADSKPDQSQASTSLIEAMRSHTVIGGNVCVKAARDVVSDTRAAGVHGSPVICEGSQSAPTDRSDAVDKNTAPANVSFENQEENNALFNGTECELGCCVGAVKATCIHLEIKSDARDMNPTEKKPSSYRGKSVKFGHLFEFLITVTCIAVHVWHNADLLCRISLLKENILQYTTDVIGVLWPLTFNFVLVIARLWEYLINQCSRWRLLAHQFCAHFKSHLLNVPLSLMANLVMSSCIAF